MPSLSDLKLFMEIFDIPVVAKVIYLHLFVILFTGGVSAPGGVSAARGVSAPGVSAPGGVCSRGGLLPGGSASDMPPPQEQTPLGPDTPSPQFFFFLNFFFDFF